MGSCDLKATQRGRVFVADAGQIPVEVTESASGVPEQVAEPPPLLSARQRSIYHTGVLIVSVIVLLLSATMSVQGTTQVSLPSMSAPLPELCLTRRMLKLPCPGCGMTRAFISIGHGHWTDAWNFNPVSFIAYLVVVAQIPWRIMQLVRVRRGVPDKEPVFLNAFLVVFVVLLLSQWLIRLVV